MVSTRSRTTSTSPSPAGDRALKRGAVSDVSTRPNKKMATTSATGTSDLAVVGTGVTKEVTLRNHEEKEVAFVDTFRHQGVVFFMFPRANTPGCTTQACGFRDNIKTITNAGFTVYGLSRDSPTILNKWKTKQKLPFDLLSDPDMELISYFGSSVGGTKVQRSHVVILQGGVVGDIAAKVSPADSVSRAVKFVTEHGVGAAENEDTAMEEEPAKEGGSAMEGEPAKEEESAKEEKLAKEEQPAKEGEPAMEEKLTKEEQPAKEGEPAKEEKLAEEVQPAKEGEPAKDEEPCKEEEPANTMELAEQEKMAKEEEPAKEVEPANEDETAMEEEPVNDDEPVTEEDPGKEPVNDDEPAKEEKTAKEEEPVKNGEAAKEGELMKDREAGKEGESTEDGEPATNEKPAKDEELVNATKLVEGNTIAFNVELQTDASATVKVQDLFKTRGAIFFMYPKADTPGCTTQACGYNDNLETITAAGYDVYGLGADTSAELAAWKESQKYKYTFLSDPQHQLIGYFGSSANNGTRVERSHVIVLPGGNVGQIEHNISPQDSVQKGVAFVKSHIIDMTSKL